MDRRYALAGAAAIVVTAVLAYMAGSRGASQSAEPRGEAPAQGSAEPGSRRTGARLAANLSDQSAARSPTTGASATRLRPTESLPPRDTPVAQVYDALAASARSGDAAASCRLAQDLERCRGLAEQKYAMPDGDDVRMIADSRERGSSERQISQQIELFAHMREVRAELESLCTGVSAERTHEAYDWLLLAADQGNVAAAGHFVASMPFDMGRIFERMDQITTYRDRAPALARRALEGGNPEIVQFLADAYSMPADAPWRSPFAQLVSRDPVEGYALFRLHAQLTGASDSPDHKHLERLALELTPAQRSAAEARAAALRAGPYAEVPLQTDAREIARSMRFCESP